jgi:large subunit ribosomal protein L11
MAKKLKAIVRLQLEAGKANPRASRLVLRWQAMVSTSWRFARNTTPAHPTARAKFFPAEITIYTDGSFTFVLRTPPAAVLLRKAAKIEKGSGVPNKEKVGKVTRAQVKEIAELKMKDLNAISLEGAMKQIEGTARSMGITVTE